MSAAPYVRLSPPALTPLMTDRGIVPVQGCHALAGFQVLNAPFNSELPFEPLSPEVWSDRQIRFWRALGIALGGEAEPWQTSFELRVVAGGSLGEPILASLWVKTFAPQDYLADQAAADIAAMMAAFLPAPCQAKMASTPAEFADLWGEDSLLWLGEVRRAVRLSTSPVENKAATSDRFWMSELAPGVGGFREAWNKMEHFPERVWLSIALCPTRLFESEQLALQERYWNEACQASGELDIWKERRQSWSPQAFLTRIRFGGDPTCAQWLGYLLCAAAMEGKETGEESPWHTPQATIVVPESLEDWEAARFNWEWGEFIPWAAGGCPLELQRLPYLASIDEVGVIAGIWG